MEDTGETAGSELPLACTLDGADGAARLRRWRALAEQSPPQSRRDGHLLELTWRLDASGTDELHALVAGERECCAFVTWSLSRRGRDTVLTIAAEPGRAGDLDAVAILFAAG